MYVFRFCLGWVFVAVWAFSLARQWGLLVVERASHCGGFSGWCEYSVA